MAINQDRNNNLQITLSKADYNRLLEIQEQVSALLSVDLSKSQTIAFLIKNYGTTPKPTANESTPSKPKSLINYQAQIRALKDKLGVSFTELSQILGIPPSTLKKYANGTQQPKADKEQIIKDALKRYGIK